MKLRPMLKRLLWALTLLSVFQGTADAAGKDRFGIMVTAGLGRCALKDVNAYLNGFSSFLLDSLRTANYAMDKEFEAFHSGRDFEISVWIPLASQWFLTLGSGFLAADKSGNTSGLRSSFSTLTTTLGHSVSAVPLQAGLGYVLPLSKGFSLRFFSGAGIYLTKFSETGERTLILLSGSPGYTTTWNADLKATGLGFYGGAGLELALAKGVALVAEAQGRYARITGFTGMGRLDFGGSTSKRDVTLYYYEFSYLDAGRTYSELSLPNSDHGYPLKVLREAAIDLSGFAIKAGLKINF